MDIRFNTKKWELWGNWSNCILFDSIFHEWSNSKIYRELNSDIKGYMKTLRGNYYVLKEDLEKLQELAINSIETDGKYLKHMFRICDRRVKELLKLEHKNNLRRFIVEMVDFGGLTDTIELTSHALDSYFQEVCKNSGRSLNEFMSFLRPSRRSPIMTYFDELRKVKNIGKFVKKFEWVGTQSLEGEGLIKKKVLEEMKRLKINSDEKLKKIPKEFDSIYWAASELIFQRANIMETLNKVAYSYRKEFIRLGKKYGLSYNQIINLTGYEILELIDNGNLPTNVKNRTRDFGIVNIDNEYFLLFGKDLEKEIAIHEKDIKVANEVKGVTAYPGKVRGTAKVLMDYEDVRKVKEGDIILAPETTVDYVIAMGRAAAFVTEQGGVTSHAAVISREMKKPCIIGTKIATKIFKDGDYIEVDANKGVVRKIKLKS